MKLNKLVFPIFLLGLVACSEDEIGNSDNWKVEGVVPANFVGCINKTIASRSTTEGIWEPGNAIGISGSEKYVNCKYVAETQGTDRHFTPATKEDSIYFETATPISFTAYYPYTGSTGTAAGVINKTIKAEDQTLANQTNIDYLFGTGQGSKASPLVALELEHKMALITFKFVNGYDENLDQMINFTVNGLKLEGTFNTASGVAKATSETTASLTVDAEDYSETTSYEKSLILFPQDNLQLDMFADFGDYQKTGDIDGLKKIESGYKYTCIVKVNRGGLEVKVDGGVQWTDEEENTTPELSTSYKVYIPALPQSVNGISDLKLSIGGQEITDYTESSWKDVSKDDKIELSFKLDNGKRVTSFDGSPFQGTCKMQFSYDGSGVSKCTYSEFSSDVKLADFNLEIGDDVNAATEPKVGDYYYSDGTWGSETEDKDIIGIIFNVGVGSGPGNFWGMNKYSGYVLALTNTDKITEEDSYGANDNPTPDDRGRCIWGEGYDMSIISSEDTECLGYMTLSKVKKMSNFESGYFAIYNASTFDVNAPANTSRWYLPSVGEFKLLSANYGTVHNKIKDIDDKACDLMHWWRYFWTSSKSSDNMPIYLDWNDNNNFSSFIKTGKGEKNALVRPILTF